MSRRKIDKETAHRRAAAPSINFSLLPQSPDLQAMLEEAGLAEPDEQGEPAPASEPPPVAEPPPPEPAARAAPPLPPPPGSGVPAPAPKRSPYRARAADGRTVEPFDVPSPGTPSPSKRVVKPPPPAPSAPAPPARRANPAGAQPQRLKQSEIPTLQLELKGDQPLPEPDDTLPPLPRAPRVSHRGSGPTITAPDDDLDHDPGPPPARPPAAHALPPSPPPTAAEISERLRDTPPDLPEPPEPPEPPEQPDPLGPRGQPPRGRHRAMMPSESPPDTPPPAPSPRSSYEPASPTTDKCSTLVNEPPDQAFFEENAPIEEQEIRSDIEMWERRRWIRRLTALVVVVLLIGFFSLVALAGFVALLLETQRGPAAAPPPAATAPAELPAPETTPPKPEPPAEADPSP